MCQCNQDLLLQFCLKREERIRKHNVGTFFSPRNGRLAGTGRCVSGDVPYRTVPLVRTTISSISSADCRYINCNRSHPYKNVYKDCLVKCANFERILKGRSQCIQGVDCIRRDRAGPGPVKIGGGGIFCPTLSETTLWMHGSRPGAVEIEHGRKFIRG